MFSEAIPAHQKLKPVTDGPIGVSTGGAKIWLTAEVVICDKRCQRMKNCSYLRLNSR